MKNKKQLINSLLFILTCTVAFPAPALNLSDWWNRFKQNPQAQIIAGFSAAAATVSALGYLAYKYSFQRPANVNSLLTNRSSGSDAFNSIKPKTLNPNLDSKHSQERLDGERDTLGNLVNKSYSWNPSYRRNESSPAYVSALKNKPLYQTPLPHAYSASSASGSQAPVKVREMDGGGNGSKLIAEILPVASAIPLSIKKIKEASPTPQENAALALAAINKAQADIKQQQDEETAKIAPFFENMNPELQAITRKLLREDVTLEIVEQQLKKLEEMCSQLFSFNVMGNDPSQRFIDNFKKTTINPKEAKKALVSFGIINSAEIGKPIKVSEIRCRIDKLIKEIEQQQEKTKEPQQFASQLFHLRQLRYVFSNDIIWAQYDAYANDRPVVSITKKMHDDAVEEIQVAKTSALAIRDEKQKKQQKENRKKNWIEPYEIVAMLGRKNPTVSTSTTHVDLGAQLSPIDEATSLIHPEQSSQPATASNILMSTISTFTSGYQAIKSRLSPTKEVATPTSGHASDGKTTVENKKDLMSKAGEMLYSAASCAVGATAALIERISPPTVPASTTVIPDRPAPVVMDHSAAAVSAPVISPVQPAETPLIVSPVVEPAQPAADEDQAMHASHKAPLSIENASSIKSPTA